MVSSSSSYPRGAMSEGGSGDNGGVTQGPRRWVIDAGEQDDSRKRMTSSCLTSEYYREEGELGRRLRAALRCWLQ